MRGVFGLLEGNIMIYLGIPGLESLPELPSEPWVGGDYAYQVPAYHWALRTMVKERKVNVDAEDVLKAINDSLGKYNEKHCPWFP